MRREFIVKDEESGITLAALLRRRLDDIPWSRAQRLCETGKVLVGSAPALDPSTRVQRGECVCLDEQARPPQSLPYRIAYEDAHVVVIDKPSGVSSVPYEKREGGTAMDLVREAWRREGKRATSGPLYVVHRIDKETSGLLAFAKTKLAERSLEALFRAHDIERTYLCVAHGHLGDRRIESRLIADRGDGLRGSTRHVGQGKRAVTHVRAVEALPDTTLLEVRLETGKTHQIRIHLSENGHPLVGERVYIRDYLRKGHEPIPSPRLLLHAATLAFLHPITGKTVRLASPLPDDFARTLTALRRRPQAMPTEAGRGPSTRRSSLAPGRRPGNMRVSTNLPQESKRQSFSSDRPISPRPPVRPKKIRGGEKSPAPHLRSVHRGKGARPRGGGWT
jgi:23S rRNA pseudouridine1911/1915/1917 synthase